MCANLFKKKKKTTTVQTQAPQQVQDFYNATADATKKAAAKPFVSYGTQASDYVAPLTEQQRAGMAGVNATVGAYKPFMQAGVNATNAGLGYMGTGMNTIGQGLGVAGSGLSNMNAGAGYIGQGTNYVGQGMGTVGQGVGTVNQGVGIAQGGLSNINTGSNYVNQGMGTVGQGTAATQAAMGPANLGSLDIQKYLSPYLSEVRDSTAALMNQANNQAQSQALGTAISSGAFGGDRAGIAAANLNQQNQLAMGNTMANIGNQGYQFATNTAQGQQTADLAARQANLQRLMDAGAQFGQLGTQQGELGAKQGTLGTQRAQIGTAVGNMGAQLGTLGTQQGELGTAMGNLGAQQTAVGSAKGTLGTQIGQMGTAQADIGTNVMGAGKQLAGFGSEQQRLDLEAAGAQMNSGAVQQQNQQAGIDAMINRFMQEQGYDFQTAQFMANQYATIGPLYGSTTTTTRPTNIFGNPVKTGGRVNGYAKGGGIAGPMTMSQMPLYEESYIPERIFSASPLLTGEEAAQAQKKEGNFISDALKIAALFGGKAEGGAVDDRHGYALDGSVEDLGNRIRLDDALIEQFGGVKPVVSDGKDDFMQHSRYILGTNPQYPGSKIYSPLTTEQLRDNINDPDYYDKRGFETERNLANARDRVQTNPANMGIGAGYNMGYRTYAHPYPPSPTTGVAAPSPAALPTLWPPNSPKITLNPDGSSFLTYRDGTVSQRSKDQTDARFSFYGTSAEEVRASQTPASAAPTTTGVAAPSPIAALQLSPEDNAARRAMMAKALGAREPRASERYMLPTGLVRPPVNAIKELNLGAGDPFGAFTASARAPENGDARPSVVDEKPPTISSRLPASLASPDSNASAIRLTGLAGADVTSPISQSSPPRLGGLGAADAAPRISQSPPPYPDGLGAADVAADAMRTIKVEPALSDGLSGDNFARASSEGETPSNGVAGPANAFGAAVEFTLQHEGGFNPRDANGAPVNYGINQAAHPEVDVSELTQDQAREIYRRDYWLPINGDALSAQNPALATAVFDTAVMSGVGTAKDLLAKSGGDRQKFLQLRTDYLNNLVQSNPEKYGKYAKAWNTRNLDLGAPNIFGSAATDRDEGLGGADMSQQGNDPLRINKPYEDRNLIGKFFHEKDTGKLDRNAIMALLSGVGGMVSSDSMSPLTALLQGAAVGSNTYKDLIKQTADVEQTTLANVQNAMKNYSYAVYNGMTDLSWPEYAAQQGIDLTALRGVPTLMGQPPVDRITVADTRSFVTRNVNGVDIKIPFMQDFQSLNDLINQNIGAQSDPSNPMSSVVAQAIVRRDEIAKTGTTVGKDQFGNDVVYKDPTAFGAITTESERQAAVGRNERFGASSEAFSSSAPVVDSSINELTNILTTIAPGITNPLIALGDSLGSAFGLTSGDYAAKTQAALAKALEPMIADAISGKMTGPAAEALAQVRSQLMSPTMQPGAVRDSIATARAVIDYQRQAYDEYYNKGGQNAPDVMGDPMKFMQEYEKKHRFADVKEKYMDYHVTPPLLGEPAPPEYLALPNTSQDKWNSYPTQTKIEMLDKIAERAAANQGG